MTPTTPRERNKSRFCERNIIGKEEKIKEGRYNKAYSCWLAAYFDSQGSGDR
jgi:hypothetical protein